jgi:xanthine phosphoribosyltransferase
MKKTYLTDANIQGYVNNIIRQMTLDNFIPDYVVGITRGGLLPAVMISHYYNVQCETLKVSLRDDGETESNLWMAEDAFGAVELEERKILKSRWDINKRKNILIVDDINDTGATFSWIKNDWRSSCLPNEDDAWDSVWRNNVKFATLIDNEASEFNEVSYSGSSVNTHENPTWFVFPWENWWNKD